MSNQIRRRDFLKRGALAATAIRLFPTRAFADAATDHFADERIAWELPANTTISFHTDDAVYQSRHDSALNVLAANVQTVPQYSDPVLIEGSLYRGIWLECAPHEGLAYSAIRPDIARNNHLAFFRLQHEDGQLPCCLKVTATGWGQIQMVVPIAATAWELVQQTNDNEFLEIAYKSCAQWDAWLRRYRDTRKTGLCEGFCTYDTGHDNSPRWAGLPNRCPDGDARKCPPIPSLPRLCPDLSATVYGGRVALAAMARALGKNGEADRWLEDANQIQKLIVDRLYDANDAAFYDLDAQNKFVRIRGDLISRVLGEQVADRKLFEEIYKKQIHNLAAFWAPYPLPSIALNDPTFVRPIPRNSWGGASQALTALRAPRWMEHYSKPADLAHLMQQWVAALVRASDFRQQMDPISGDFTADAPGYSPAALVFLDFTWRLSGVRKLDRQVEWNIRPLPPNRRAGFQLSAGATATANIKYDSGHAELFLNNRLLFSTGNVVRVITDLEGIPREAVGIAAERTEVELSPPGRKPYKFAIEPNARLSIGSLA
jgi:hypothetical protein